MGERGYIGLISFADSAKDNGVTEDEDKAGEGKGSSGQNENGLRSTEEGWHGNEEEQGTMIDLGIEGRGETLVQRLERLEASRPSSTS